MDKWLKRYYEDELDVEDAIDKKGLKRPERQPISKMQIWLDGRINQIVSK